VEFINNEPTLMEVTQENCTTALHDQFIHGGFSQIENVSKLMKDSRWDDKSACLSSFNNSIVAVKDTLNIWMETEEEKIEIKEPIKEETKQEKSSWNRFQASVESVDFNNINSPEQILNLLWLVGKWILVFLLMLFLISLFIRVWKRFLRYAYAFCNSHRLIFLKVLLPRW